MINCANLLASSFPIQLAAPRPSVFPGPRLTPATSFSWNSLSASTAQPGLPLAKAAAPLWGCDIEVVAYVRSVADDEGPAAQRRYLSSTQGSLLGICAADPACYVQRVEAHSPHLAPAVHTRNAASRPQADSLSALLSPRFPEAFKTRSSSAPLFSRLSRLSFFEGPPSESLAWRAALSSGRGSATTLLEVHRTAQHSAAKRSTAQHSAARTKKAL